MLLKRLNEKRPEQVKPTRSNLFLLSLCLHRSSAHYLATRHHSKFEKKQGRPTFSNLSPIETFKRFICVTIIGLVVISTNAYAKRQRAEDIQNQSSSARTWKPTTIGEIYRYIGVWLYMGMHPEAARSSFWSQTHRLGRYMSRNRFAQIHRYFSTRDTTTHPRQPNESFAWKLEPISTILRQNIFRNWSPGTHVAIDEAMIAFRGRTLHKVKMKNKPIDEGYKTWMAAQSGYTLTWKWHSKLEGPEGVSPDGIDAPHSPYWHSTSRTYICGRFNAGATSSGCLF